MTAAPKKHLKMRILFFSFMENQSLYDFKADLQIFFSGTDIEL